MDQMFGRHRRKIMPAGLPLHPGESADYTTLAAYVMELARVVKSPYAIKAMRRSIGGGFLRGKLR